MDMQRQGRAAGRRVAAEAGDSDKYKGLARLGYASRGVVYIIVGAFAVLAAWGGGGRTTDTKGALRSLMDEPFGAVLIGVLALGLVAFAAWRVVQGIADADHHGSDGKAMMIRGGFLVSAVTNLLLALFAASLALGWGSGGSGSGGGGGTRTWIAKLMEQPFGVWLVAVVGLAVIGAGVAQIIKGVKVKFEKHFGADESTMRWLRPVCRFGLIARGVVFVIIGGFIGIAAWQSDPQEARGLAGALEALQSQPYGQVLLGIVALGLIAFGLYCFIAAIYRRIGLGVT